MNIEKEQQKMKWPKWMQPTPMPAWYWAVYWTVSVGWIVLYVGWWNQYGWSEYHFFTALYVVWCLVLTPLMYKRGQPGFKLLAALLCVVLAAAMLWPVLGGSLTFSWYALTGVLIGVCVSAACRIWNLWKERLNGRLKWTTRA